MNPRILRE